jgi:hypothetical protein
LALYLKPLKLEPRKLTYETDDDNVVTVNYDNRMRVSEHKVSSPLAAGGYAQKATFNYTADSRTDVMDNQVDNKFDRTFKYDFAGRLTANNFGNATDGVPYTQTLQYDQFSLLTHRSITHWGQPGGFGATYVNGRKQAAGSSTPSYDAAGNMLSSGLASGGLGQTMTFDAAGRQKSVSTVSRHRVGIVAMASFENVITEIFDGDGHPLKEENAHRRLNMSPPQQLVPENKYQIWSSVLNLAVTELNNTGAKKTTKVMAGGAVIAEQTLLFGNQVIWKSADPVTGSNIQISQNGDYYVNEEFEPLGQQVLPVQPFEEMPTSEGVAIQGADEPEGLCSAMEKHGTSFLDLPSVCRDIAIKNGRVSFEDVHPSKYSITRIALHDAGPHGSSHQPVAPAEHTPTNKPSEATSADVGGECPKDKNGIVIQPCIVDGGGPGAIDMSIPGADASQSGDDELEALLRAMAGPAAGPDGGPTIEEMIVEIMEIARRAAKCGVNPVTGKPGIDFKPISGPFDHSRPGTFGNLRKGIGGAGGFKERSKGKHAAIDIVSPVGTPTVANRDGKVVAILPLHGDLGNTVVIDHGGVYTSYSHLSSFSVGLGPIRQGDVVGRSGRTGNVPKSQLASEDHVHFGVFDGLVNGNFLPLNKQWQDGVKYLNSPCPP